MWCPGRVLVAPLQSRWKNFVEIHNYILQGGGEHARVVLDCLLTAGAKVTALFDPKYQGDLFGVPQRGSYSPSFEPGALAIVAIGDNRLRQKVAAITRHKFGNAIHPSVIFSKYASMGEGCMLLQGAIVQAQTRLGNHVILNTGCQVDHDCRIGDFVHIGPAACLGGTVEVGEGAFVGAGAVIIPGIHVGKWASVGAGAVVLHHVPDHVTVVGNPAKVLRGGKD